MNSRVLLLVLAVLMPLHAAFAYNFSISTLPVTITAGATSLQFGPDQRLYVALVNGQIKAFTIVRAGPNNYQVTATEDINLVAGIPNYDDSGTRNFTLTSRQVTGLLVMGTAVAPVLYVTSSDPRIGGGAGGENDLNLDTNSGILSRLTRNGSSWTKVDLVRGLPRSEENHASNGMQLEPITNILYLAQGGNTNAGGPSINFAYACETALSGAILSIDLNALNALPVKTDAYGQKYLYNLPTLNDPNPARSRNADGSNLNDPFGGNDGLNQAKLVPGGPVQIYAPGFRNVYDLLLTRAPGREGRLYTFDNGANQGWGGYPKNEGPNGTVTNEYVEGEPGTVNNLDNFHFISARGYYGGHPNPLRANPAGAGWFHFDNTLPPASQKIFSANPTSDWPAVPLSLANPVEGDFRQPGTANGALLTNNSSTNGLAEYVATNFSGEMQGNVIAATYDGRLLRIALTQTGTAVTNGLETLAAGFGSIPLDVTTPDPGNGAPFVGTIWVAHYSPPKISVLEPADFDSPGGSTCTGINSFAVDEDGDGYSNADEIANDSNPCSGAIRPPDADGDFVSDLLDQDDDNDGLVDTEDPFPRDAQNGKSVPMPVRYDFFNDAGTGFFSVGLTGLMMNRGEDYLQRMSADNVIAGGTAGLFTLAQAGPGVALGSSKNQKDAYQFAINSDAFTTPYVITSRLAGPFFANNPISNQRQGIYLGTGDQDNFIWVALHANGGAGALEVVYEQGGTVLAQQLYPFPNLTSNATIDLSFAVDPAAGTVHPRYLPAGGTSPVALGSPIHATGQVLQSIVGSTPLAVGLFATTSGAASTFSATWDYFEVTPQQTTAIAKVTIDPSGSDMATSSTYVNGSFVIQNLSNGGQQIQAVTIDLSTAIFPDMVYDPTGTAGDLVAKPFQADSATGGVSLASGINTHPHNGVNGQDGYDLIDLTFNAFPVNGTFSFSIDCDPTNVKGVAAPGQGDSASVSGLELIGSTATVYFNDGSVHRTRVGRVQNSVDGGYGWLRSDQPPKPGVSLVGQSSPLKSGQAQQTVRVTAPAGFTASVVTVEGALYLGGVPNGGYDVDPYEANTALKVTEVSGLIPAVGFKDFVVSPTRTNANAGFNYITAILSNSSNITGPVSDKLTVWYDPSFSGVDTEPPTKPGSLATPNVSPRSVTLSWTASTDNGGVRNYEIRRDGTVVSTTISLTYTDVGLEAGTVYNYSVVARDEAGNVSLPATIAAPTPNNGTVVLRVNAGGPAIVDTKGHTWAADSGFNTGTTSTTTTAIDRAVDDSLFQTARMDSSATAPDLAYAFSLANGQYEVQLFFAELVTANAAVGKRVFDVVIESQLAFDNLDIFALAGAPFTAVVMTATTTVIDGQLNIAFPRGISNPKVNAIKVVKLATTEPEPPSPSILRINAGGPDYVDTAGRIWMADMGFNTGGLATASATVSGTTEPELFKTERYDPSTAPALTYTLAVPNGSYRVRLYFAETYSATKGAGLRVFSINLQGVLTFENVDIFEQAGGADQALVLEAPVTVSNGLVTIGFINQVQNSKINAIEILAATTTDTQPPTTPGGLTFTAVTSDSITVNWTAATDNIGITGYRVSRGTTELATITALKYIDTGLTAGTSYNYSVVAIDAAGNASSASSGTAATSGGGSSSTIRVNAGGPSYVDAADNDWSADTGYNTGSVSTTTTAVTGTTDPTLYKTSRYPQPSDPPLTYTFAMPNGSYLVRLHFAETYAGTMATGERVFDVDIQSARAFEDVDIFARVGGNKALVLEKTTSVTNGQMKIGFVRQVENPKINAIEIVPVVSALPIRINAGGPSYVDTAGNSWAADIGYNTGSVSTTTTTVTSTTNPTLYKTSRYPQPSDPPLTYTFSVPSGNYLVKLHFAETYSGTMAIGERVFDVDIQSARAFEDLDIFARIGGNKALVLEKTVSATNGQVKIGFIRQVENPKINAIEILAATSSDTQPPTAPTGLVTSNLTTTGVTLSWTAASDNTGVTGYRVSRGGTLLNTVTATSFTDSGLTPATTYTYTVVAIDAANNVSPAASRTITTIGLPDTQPPTAPTGLAASNVTTTGVTLSWTAASDNTAVTGYRVSRGGTLLNTVTVTSFANSGLTPGTAYSYSVVAIDAAGNVSPAASLTVTTVAAQDTQPPTAPTGLAASNLTTTGVTLSWTAASDNTAVTGYRVSRGGTLLNTVTITSFADSGLTPGTAYSYSVVAIDAAGNVSPAASLTVTTVAAPDTQPPTAPTGLTSSNVTATGLTLSWTAASDNRGVTGYRVSRGSTLLNTVTTTTFTDSGLTAATTYNYSVVAVDAASNTSPAATHTVTTAVAPDTQPPSAPGTLTFSNVTSNSVTVHWTAATDNVGVVGYRISRGATVLATVSTLAYTNTGLAAGTSYTYSVVALDAAGNASSPRSGTISTTSSGGSPVAIRVNAGGPSYVDNAGNTWVADTGFNTGQTETYTSTVTGTLNPTLFRTERHDKPGGPDLTYTLLLANGPYRVRLHFAETDEVRKAVGQRVFSVNLQGVRTFQNVDIFAQAGGGNRALVLEAPITVSAGRVTIDFINQVRHAKINAIEIVPVLP